MTGVVLLVVLCAVTDWTIRLIVINAKLSGRNSYIEIMHQCYGASGRAAVSFFQFAFAFGGPCHWHADAPRHSRDIFRSQGCVHSESSSVSPLVL